MAGGAMVAGQNTSGGDDTLDDLSYWVRLNSFSVLNSPTQVTVINTYTLPGYEHQLIDMTTWLMAQQSDGFWYLYKLKPGIPPERQMNQVYHSEAARHRIEFFWKGYA
jgi:hypothetical protein